MSKVAHIFVGSQDDAFLEDVLEFNGTKLSESKMICEGVEITWNYEDMGSAAFGVTSNHLNSIRAG